jgi:ABC-type sugar transport system substrate-binding protein
VVWTNAATDERKQACDVAHLLAIRPDVLVLHPAHTVQSDALFRAAVDAGVPAICFQRPARSDAFALFAGGDTYAVGEAQIEHVAERLDGHGNVVLLEGDPYNDSARNLAEGSRRALSRFPGLRLVADEVCPDWSPVHARRAVAELLSDHGKLAIHAVVCANDAMAAGVAGALAERDRTGWIVLVGHDGDLGALERLRSGAQDATFFQDPSKLALETLGAAVALARGTLDVSTLPRRSPAVNPPARAVPVLDVPYLRITSGNAHVLGAYWHGLIAG